MQLAGKECWGKPRSLVEHPGGGIEPRCWRGREGGDWGQGDHVVVVVVRHVGGRGSALLAEDHPKDASEHDDAAGNGCHDGD